MMNVIHTWDVSYIFKNPNIIYYMMKEFFKEAISYECRRQDIPVQYRGKFDPVFMGIKVENIDGEIPKFTMCGNITEFRPVNVSEFYYMPNYNPKTFTEDETFIKFCKLYREQAIRYVLFTEGLSLVRARSAVRVMFPNIGMSEIVCIRNKYFDEKGEDKVRGDNEW